MDESYNPLLFLLQEVEIKNELSKKALKLVKQINDIQDLEFEYALALISHKCVPER